MSDRPYVLLSCAMSVDGHIDDTSPGRLRLSSDEDFERVDAERARADAILVGAGTVRRDDPALLVRSATARGERAARGLPPNPARVTLTRAGDLDPSRRLFADDEATRLVYCASGAVDGLRERLGARATVVDAGDPPDLRLLLGDLASRGVRRLMVEGGTQVHTEFLAQDLADELHLVVAPFFVGDPRAPRFVSAASFPHGPDNPMTLAETRRLGDTVLMRYLLNLSR